MGIWGLYPILKLLQFQAKEHIEHMLLQQLPDNRLEVFENPESHTSFVWEEKGEEFHYKNEMYDVVREKQVNGKTLVYCVNDRKESQIYNCLEALVNRQLGDNNTTTGAANHYLIRLLTQVYILSDKQPTLFSLVGSQHNKLCYYTIGYPSLFLEIASPPPKVS
jgi:hypothetical protein